MNLLHLKKGYYTLLFLTTSFLATSQNPFITHIYTADPTARVYNETLYVYPSHDVDTCNEMQGSNGFCMPDYHMFSTKDMVNWKDHGVIMDQNEVPWGLKNRYGMWAPSIAYKNGTYYYYYPGMPADKSAFRRVGVATSKSPTGPFKQIPNYINKVKGIDPDTFVDDDGRAYLYWGGGKGKGALKCAELNEDMVSIKGQPRDVEGIIYERYREASFVFKRNGIYYFTYARVGNNNYQIEYATAKNPLGPFKYRGVLLENIGNGTNHHSIVKFKDKWYLFYHNWAISGHNKLRSICADKMEFNKNGTIKPVEATLRGIGTPKAGDIIQIDSYNEISGAKRMKVEGNQPRGFMLGDIANGGFVKFDRVNFGNGSLKELKVRAACGGTGGELELRTGSETGQLLATVKIAPTGSFTNWKDFSAPFTGKTTGVKDIVCVFKGEGNNLFNVNWIKFSSADVAGSNQKLPYEFAGAPEPTTVNPLSREEKARMPKLRNSKKVSKIGEIIQIDSHNGISGCKVAPLVGDTPPGKQVGFIDDGSFVKINKIDFGKGGLTKLIARISSGGPGGRIELRLDNPKGELLATVPVPNTGNWRTWKTVEGDFNNQTTGIKNVVFLFKGNGNNLFNVNWVQIASKYVKRSNEVKFVSTRKLSGGATVSTVTSFRSKSAGHIIPLVKNNGNKNARPLPNKKQIGYIKNGGYIKIENIDFGSGNLNSMKVKAASRTNGGDLEFRLGSKDGPLLTSMKIPSTGDWKKWKIFNGKITGTAKGIQTLYLVFQGKSDFLYNLEWIRFSANDVPASLKPSKKEKGLPIVEAKVSKGKRRK